MEKIFYGSHCDNCSMLHDRWDCKDDRSCLNPNSEAKQKARMYERLPAPVPPLNEGGITVPEAMELSNVLFGLKSQLSAKDEEIENLKRNVKMTEQIANDWDDIASKYEQELAAAQQTITNQAERIKDQQDELYNYFTLVFDNLKLQEDFDNNEHLLDECLKWLQVLNKNPVRQDVTNLIERLTKPDSLTQTNKDNG